MGKGRTPCCDKNKVKRGPWSPAEDLRLITFIQKNGHDNWRALPKQAGNNNLNQLLSFSLSNFSDLSDFSLSPSLSLIGDMMMVIDIPWIRKSHGVHNKFSNS